MANKFGGNVSSGDRGRGGCASAPPPPLTPLLHLCDRPRSPFRSNTLRSGNKNARTQIQTRSLRGGR